MTDAKLDALHDRIAITEVLSALGRWLDDKRWDEAEAVLTPDVRVATPGGVADGLATAVAQARRNHDDVTQHLFANVTVDLDGDRASATAESLIAVVDGDAQRWLGSRYAVGLVRTAVGWRIEALTVTPIWASDPVDTRRRVSA